MGTAEAAHRPEPQGCIPFDEFGAAGQSRGGGREAHSRPAQPVLPSLPVLLLQGEPRVTARGPDPHAGSVSLASRHPSSIPEPLGCPLGPAAYSRRGAVCGTIPGSPEPVFLFRQTNKSRFGYHGRAVRRPTQTEAARLASPDAPGSVQAFPGHLPRSRSGLVTLSLLLSSRRPSDRGPRNSQAAAKDGNLAVPGWVKPEPSCTPKALECPASEGLEESLV